MKRHRARTWFPLALLASTAGLPPVLADVPEALLPVVEAVDTGGLETKSAALILSGQEGGELDASLTALPLVDAEGRSSVALWVDIPGAALLQGSEDEMLLTEVYAYALTPEDEIASYLTRAFRLELETFSGPLSSGGLRFRGHLALDPGEYSLRLLVLQRQTDRFALRVEPLKVPSWSNAEGPIVLPPLFLDGMGDAVQVRSRPGEQPFPEFSPRLEDRALEPVTATALDSAAETTFYVAGRNLPGELTVRLLDSGNQERQRVELVMAEAVAEDVGGLELRRVALPALSLPDGEYRIEVTAEAAEPAVAATRPMFFTAGGLGSFGQPAGDPALALGEVDPEGNSNRLATLESLDSRIGVEYLDALSRLAAGDKIGARQEIMNYELAALGSGKLPERTNLLKKQLTTLGLLASRRPESLVPVIVFHENLYRHYHQQRQYLLSTHARNLLARLMEFYLGRSRREDASTLVADVMASMGGYMLEIGADLSAQRAFENALAHDRNQTLALLGAASIDETYGAYGAAVEKLERLLTLEPNHREAALRLAINALRQDDTETAETHLRRCLGLLVDDWIAVVGFQELANLLDRENRGEEAIELLETAIHRFPENQRFYIQLAALLDRQGRRGKSFEVLAKLDPSRGRTADSPRHLYSQRPAWRTEAERHQLALAARDDLETLAKVVGQYLGGESHAASP